MKNFFESIRCAWRGFKKAFDERNFFVETICGILVVLCAIVLKTSYIENAILLICIGLVLGAEAMNTAIERLSDFVSPSHHDEIGAIKDLMAAGVLIFSLTALAVGITILGWHLLLLL